MDTTTHAVTQKKLYGKRPLWQWITIYLVIGAIVYGAIYFFFLNKGYGYSNVGYSSNHTQQQSQY